MTIGMKAVVELFRVVGREEELHCRIIGFSYSHDHEAIRIWGHYPVINGESTMFRRHAIRKYNFTERKGQEKWTAYIFTKNLYDEWLAPYFHRICTVIDDLPEHEGMERSLVSETHLSEATGLSQPLENEHLVEISSSQSSLADVQQFTPDNSTYPEQRTRKEEEKRKTKRNSKKKHKVKE